MSTPRNYILQKETAARKLARMAYEIAEQNIDETGTLILAGIKSNGVVIAHILAQHLAKLYKGEVKVIEIELDKKMPADIHVSESINFDNQVIIIVDDVSNSGKTTMYALKPFLAFHPKKIQTLSLVDRSHKAFPVKPDYIGLSLSTTLQEHIYVEVEGDVVTGAYLQ